MANNNGFIGGMRTLGRAYCEYGRAAMATGNLAGVRVNFPGRAEWKYLPAGLYYHLISTLANHLIGLSLPESSPLSATSVAMASNDGPSRRAMPSQPGIATSSSGSYVARSITMQPVKNREASERVFSRVKSNSWVKKHEFTRAEFDQWFDLSFRPEELDRFPGKDELFKFMIGEFKIEKHPSKEGIYRIVSQISLLKSTSEDMDLENVETVHEICRSAEQCLGRNWTSTSLFIADPATGQVRLAARRKGNESESHYSAWAEPAYLLAEARRRYVEEDDKAFIVNLNEDHHYVDKASRASDALNFIGEKAELLVGVLVYKSREDQRRYKTASKEERQAIRARSIYGYWHVSNRVFNDEEGRAMFEENFHIANRPPISPNTNQDDLVAKLHTMVLHPVAEKIAARKEARGGSISAIWNGEEKPEENSGEILIKSPVLPEQQASEEGQVQASLAVQKEYTIEDEARLSAQPRYFTDSRVMPVKLRNGLRVNVEVIVADRSIEDHFKQFGQPGDYEKLQDDCNVVTSLATGINKEESVGLYLANSKVLLVAREPETDRFIGYVAVQPQMILGNPNIFVWGNFVTERYQSMGLATALNFQAVKISKKALSVRARSPIYLSFRTWNPAAFKIVQRSDFEVFPRPNKDGSGLQREPSPIVVSIFTKLAQDLLHSPIDVNTAIMARSVTPAKNVNWLNIPRIDTFFREVVKIAEGNAVLVTTRLPRFIEVLHPIRELWVRFGLLVKIPLRSIPGVKRYFRQPGAKVDWAEYFRAYDVLLEMIPYRRLINRMGELLQVRTGDRVLDLGSGTGNMSREIERRGGHSVAIDNSAEGIAAHRRKSPQAEIMQLNLDSEDPKLPFESDSFPKVCANNVVNYLQNRVALYRELRRVISPDGTLVLSVIRKGFKPLKVLREHMALQYKELRKSGQGRLSALMTVIRNFLRMNTQLRIIGDANNKILEGAVSGTYYLLEEGQIREELQEAGFEVVSIEKGYANQDYVVQARPVK